MGGSQTECPPHCGGIGYLLPVLQTKATRSSIAQDKALLAATLFEAHRSKAYQAWACGSLGEWMTKQNVNPRLFQKYLAAGQRLAEYMPRQYAQVMEALTKGRQPPTLPQVTKLAALPRRLGQGELPEHVQDVIGSRNTKTRSVQVVVVAVEYKDAVGEDLRLLRTVDEACVRLQELDALIARVRSRQRTGKARAVLVARLQRLEAVAGDLINTASSIRQVLLP